MRKKRTIAFVMFLLVCGAALWWLNGNVDRLIRDGIEHYGSNMTQARVQVGSVSLSLRNGAGELRRIRVGNPSGFRTDHALQVERIEVAMDVLSLSKDVIVIQRIVVQSPDIVYELGMGSTNFDVIQKNIADYINAMQGKQAQAGKEVSGKKFIVQEFSIRDAKVQASAEILNGRTVALHVPDITLRNIGKAKGGVTSEELGQEMVVALKQSLSSAFSPAKMGKSAGEVANKLSDSIKGMFSK